MGWYCAVASFDLPAITTTFVGAVVPATDVGRAESARPEVSAGTHFAALDGYRAIAALMVVLTTLGEMEAGVVAFGVIRAETFGPLSLVSGLELERNEQHLLIARAVLGDAPYNAAVARGASMSDEEALEYALRELDRVLADHKNN